MLRERVTNRPRHYNSKFKNDLSPREKEVLSLVTKGLTNAEVATSLGLAFDTVKWHVSAVLSKLGVDSREEAAAYWRNYNSLGGRIGRSWSALVGVATTKAAVIGTVTATAAVAATIAAVAIALSLRGPESPRAALETRSSDPRVGVPAKLPAGAGLPLVRAGSALFVPTSKGLVQFDPSTGSSSVVPKTDQGPLAASTSGQVWTRGIGPSTLVQVDPTSQAVRLETTLPFVIDDTTFILATDTYVWVSFWADDSVVKVSSSTGEVLSTTSLPKPKGAVLAGGSLWVSLARNDAVARLDPESMALLAEIPLGTAKDSPVCGGCVTWMFSSRDSVWAISTSPGQVTRLEASSGRVVGTLQLPGKLLAGFDAAPNGDVWVAVTPPGTLHGDLVRIDYETILEAERIGLGEGRGTLDGVSPQGIRELNGTLWVSTEQGEMIPVRANP